MDWLLENWNWAGLLAVGLLAIVGAVSLWVYHRSGNKNLLAAVAGFTAVAAALLGGALWAAGIPQLLFGSYTPTDADQGWKATQSITLTLGALGVVAASVITYHRQRSLQQQVKTGQKQLKHDRAKFNAEQQRERERGQQDRYAQGALMLADDSPAVRIAGLNVIAALGREKEPTDDLRQTCINLICAYLRNSSPAGPDSQIPRQRTARIRRADRAREIDRYEVVATEACRLLPTLLEFTPTTDTATRPVGLDLDLRNTHLVDLNLGGRSVDTARFEGARFAGSAWFEGATFAGSAWFEGATFDGSAWFEGATFDGSAWFEGATFAGSAWFKGATFAETASFGGATFTEATWFKGATFAETASFAGATFAGSASFTEATFDDDALFAEARFAGSASFAEATFAETAWFKGARFYETAWFKGARFVKYSGSEDKGLTGAVFEQTPDNPFPGACYGPPPETEASQDDKEE